MERVLGLHVYEKSFSCLRRDYMKRRTAADSHSLGRVRAYRECATIRDHSTEAAPPYSLEQ